MTFFSNLFGRTPAKSVKKLEPSSLVDYICQRLMSLPALEKVRPDIDAELPKMDKEKSGYVTNITPYDIKSRDDQAAFDNHYKRKYYLLVVQTVQHLQTNPIAEPFFLLRTLISKIKDERPELSKQNPYDPLHSVAKNYDDKTIKSINLELCDQLVSLIAQLKRTPEPKYSPNQAKRKLFLCCLDLLQSMVDGNAAIKSTFKNSLIINRWPIDLNKMDCTEGGQLDFRNFLYSSGFSAIRQSYLVSMLSDYGLVNLRQRMIDICFQPLIVRGHEIIVDSEKSQILVEGNDEQIKLTLRIKYDIKPNVGSSDLVVSMTLHWLRDALLIPYIKDFSVVGHLPSGIQNYVPTNTEISAFLKAHKKEYDMDDGSKFKMLETLSEEQYSHRLQLLLPQKYIPEFGSQLVFELLLDYILYRRLLDLDTVTPLEQPDRISRINILKANEKNVTREQVEKDLTVKMLRLEQVFNEIGVLAAYYQKQRVTKQLNNAGLLKDKIYLEIEMRHQFSDTQDALADWKRNDYLINGARWGKIQSTSKSFAENPEAVIHLFLGANIISQDVKIYNFAICQLSQYGLMKLGTQIFKLILHDIIGGYGYILSFPSNEKPHIELTTTGFVWTLDVAVKSVIMQGGFEIATVTIKHQLRMECQPDTKQMMLKNLTVSCEPAVILEDILGYKTALNLQQILQRDLPSTAEFAQYLKKINGRELATTCDPDFDEPLPIGVSRQATPDHLQIGETKMHNFFQAIHSAIKPMEYSLTAIIYQWSRQPHFIIGEQQWDCSAIKQIIDSQQTRFFNMNPNAIGQIFDGHIYSLFSPLGLTQTQAQYLAHVMSYEGLPAALITAFYHLFNAHYVEWMLNKTIAPIHLIFKKETAKIHIRKSDTGVLFGLNISICVVNEVNKDSREPPKTSFDLNFIIGLSWLETVNYPKIDSFAMRVLSPGEPLPNLSISAENFLQQLMPTASQIREFISFHVNDYTNNNVLLGRF
jgi:hypothetical protein